MLDKIKNFFRKKKLNVVHLNSEDFSENEKLQVTLNENAFLKGVLLKQKAKKGEERQGEQEKKEEKEKIKDLNKQYDELRTDKDKPVSLQKLFKLIKIREKDKKPIVFTTFDGGKNLGKVKDFVIYPDGSFGVSNEKEVIWAGKLLEDVFYWNAGLNNYVRKGMIPLCVDKEGKYTPNVMEQEIPDWVKLSTGKFKINRFNKKKLFEAIQEKDEEIQDLNKEMEATEEIVSEQQKEINEKSRETELHKSRADKSTSELSIALDKIGEIEKSQGMIIRENLALNNLKEVHEETVERMERILNKWANQVEREGGATTRAKVWEDWKEVIAFAKQNLGNQTIIQEPEKSNESLLQKHGEPRKP